MTAEPLRVTLASTHDRIGGAAVAAARLRDGLIAAGHDVKMLVQQASAPHPATVGPATAWQRSAARMRSGIDSLPVRWRGAAPDQFSTSWLPRRWPRLADVRPAQLVHLHWTNAGFLSVADIGAIRTPVVWTLHDMWAFTGGCQYDESCGRFAAGCGRCPVLESTVEDDLSARRHAAKRRAWAGRDITVVAPSRWMAAEARRSPIFEGQRIEVLKNGIDLERFKPLDRAFARQALGLPADRRLVLFGALNAAADKRKGYDLLQAALGHLAEATVGGRATREALAFVVFGSNPARRELTHGVPTYHFGHLADDVSLALLYAACDLFVAPSRQENLPNTVAEALACGTPCVGFDIGGLPDLIEHGRNGWLAPALDAQALGHGIAWCLDDADGRWHALAARARGFALEQLDLARQTARHVGLYREVLAAQQVARRDAAAAPAPADSRAPT